VTQSQFNEIMKGERDAKPAKPVEKPAPPIEASAPTPPVNEAKSEPPPPLKKLEAPEQPPAAPPTPPARPAPAHEAAAPPTPPPPPEAEVDRPLARVDAPTPPEPPSRPKPVDRPKPDQLAKLLDETKSEEPPKPPTKSKPIETPNDPHRSFDANSIAKLLGQTKPRNVEQVASATPLGAPTQNAQHMSPSMSAAIDGWLTDAYLRCWSPPPTMPEGAKYIAEIRVAFNVDGSLSAHPSLLNPPSDPAWRAYAESAMRAVMKCNPLPVPPQYAPYFEQWRTKTVHFDPENALG
jgi:colicin import membrane protein